jgi:hypothetical protein
MGAPPPPEAAPQPVLQNPTPSQPSIVLNEDGTFQEGWLDSFAGGQFKDNPTLSNFKTLEGMMKTVVNQQSMMGKDKIVKPGDNASAADWEAFYRAGGHPESIDGYKIEGMKLENDAGYEALINQNRQGFMDASKIDADAHNARIAASKEALMAKWGSEYNIKLQMANEMMSNPNVEQLVNGLNAASDPNMVELLYEMRRHTKEDSIPDNTVGQNQLSLENQLQEILIEKTRLASSADPSDMDRVTYLSDRELAIREQLKGRQSGTAGYSSSQQLV